MISKNTQNELKIDLKNGKKLFFASDFHLGAPQGKISELRERKIISWLDSIKSEAQAVFFVGDIFDFWFEYSYTIPKGFSRFMGKLAEISDAGIEIYIFPGNHDLWMFGYFQSEFKAKVFRKPIKLNCQGKSFFITHGDGLGPGDYSYKLLQIAFESRFFQYIFTLFPTNFCYWIAENWSQKSRISNLKFEERFLGEKEWLWQFSKEIESKNHHDFYIFGHRHLVLDLPVNQTSRYINLGEWYSGEGNFGVFDGNVFNLEKFNSPV
ncbi:MAG: UDP-2,3-diacylglucosamine diphosphatase [Cytophagales bacterium]|nr:MAG: UDP-2,3-diacylglucosamine diphosphatase [Cytophagales bacterium]